jgi:hypothetical protein
VNYSVFIEVKASGKVEQVHETHRMRHLWLPELALYRDGLFEERSTHAWMEDGPPGAHSWAGVQVLARVAP